MGVRGSVVLDYPGPGHLSDDAVGEWHRLAVAAGRPYASPGWQLPWWEHARPPRARLATATVRDGERLTGVAPLYVDADAGVRSCRLLASPTAAFVEPLAVPGSEDALAAAVAAAAVDAGADVVSLTWVSDDRRWPSRLVTQWPGRGARAVVTGEVRAPYVDVSAGAEAWFASRSRNFRQGQRAKEKAFAAAGGSVRRVHDERALPAALDAFVRLHADRWSDRGGSAALTTPVVRMLRSPWGQGRRPLDLWLAEVGEEVVAAVVFATAGAETHYWLGGFDRRWARVSPTMLLLTAAVRQAAEDGLSRVSLGPGEQDYKHRLSTGDQLLRSVDVVRRGPRHPYVSLCRTPAAVERAARRRLPGPARAVARRVRTGASRRQVGPPQATADGAPSVAETAPPARTQAPTAPDPLL